MNVNILFSARLFDIVYSLSFSLLSSLQGRIIFQQQFADHKLGFLLFAGAECLPSGAVVGKSGAWRVGHGVKSVVKEHDLVGGHGRGVGLKQNVPCRIQQLDAVTAGCGKSEARQHVAQKDHPVASLGDIQITQGPIGFTVLWESRPKRKKHHNSVNWLYYSVNHRMMISVLPAV